MDSDVRTDPQAVETYSNPIIPGDWSDPGVVRVGQDYYSVRSTFGWQPGLLIAHSKDLIHWEYIGCADMANAFDIPHGVTDPGIWGSDIGYNPNNGTFLVYAPVRSKIRVFVSEKPEGPYRDAGVITTGYDPGFFANDDGTLYLTRSGGDVFKLTDDGLQVDGEPIAQVAGGEGPEIFRRGEYYYYLISPGGTRPYQDHMIMSYRSRSLEGPWEEDPENPVMHAPHTTNAKFQGPGHGEVFEAHNGQWYVTYHAYELSHYSLGRQMCMEPVSWTDDGWWRPINGRIPSESAPLPQLNPFNCSLQESDTFETEALGLQWFFHTTADFSGRYWSLTEQPGCLRIRTQEGDISSPEVARNLFLQRVTRKAFEVITKVTFDAQWGHESAGLHLYHDPDKNIWLSTTVVDGQKVIEVGYNDKPFSQAIDPADLEPAEIMQTLRNAPKSTTILHRQPNEIGSTVYLKITVDGYERATFFFSGDGALWTKLDAEVYFGDSWHYSLLGKEPGAPDLGWVGCGRDNVWTGTAMGVFGCRNGAEHESNADFHFFEVN